MKKAINFILSLCIFVVFLCAMGCANPNSSTVESGDVDSSSLEAELMESGEYSAAERAGSLTFDEDITLDGNPGDFAEWTFSMSKAQKTKVKWSTTGKKTKCIILVNGKQQGGRKTFGSGSRNLQLPAGTVTIRVAVDKSDSKGGKITFTKVVISSSYASKDPSSSSSSSEPASSSSSEQSSSSEPTSSSSSSSSIGPINTDKLRVMMSSDIGGTDNDDQQSMAHFLVYADMWDVEGLISSPWGKGRKKNILDAIDAYEKDYSNLKTYSSDYPTPDYLRSVTKQGATDKAGSKGYGSKTEASEWIAEVAMRDDPRPLWITVWGGIEDIAQALHDHPEIESRLRVYWIAGPNRRNSPNASKYIADNHKKLWIIEADETYRGFFNGGNMSGDLSNKEFPKQHVKGHGALGSYFMAHRTSIKMGDTPAVLYTLDNEYRNPGDPTKAGWGGAFIPYGSSRPYCWKDDPSKSSNGYDGAATVNVHREAFLRDFQARMDRCQSPK